MKIKTIVRIGVVAALYVVLTVVNPFSYDAIQFRISELLVLLCFFRKDYIYGLVCGCIIANISSPLGPIDVIVGSLATLIALLGICFSKNLFIATLIPSLVNGIIVGLELYFLGIQPILWFGILMVAVGEIVVCTVIGYPLFSFLRKKESFLELIDANQNIQN